VARANVFVWHNLSGEILAVGRPMGTAKCIPISIEGGSVLEAEVDEESIAELATTHLVDVHERALVRPGE
jgi:hypothetical protein